MASIGDLEMTLNPDDAIDALMTIRLMATKALQHPGTHWQLFLAKIEQRAAEALAKAHEARASKYVLELPNSVTAEQLSNFKSSFAEWLRDRSQVLAILPPGCRLVPVDQDATLAESDAAFPPLTLDAEKLLVLKCAAHLPDPPLESPGFLRAVQALADAEAAERAAIERDKPPRCSATLCGLVCTYPAGHEGVHGYVDPKRLEPPPDLPRGGFF